MMNKSKIDNVQPEPQPNDAVKADGIPSSPSSTKPHVICRFFGHDFKYNFPSMPNKRICKRCYKKEKWSKEPYVWDSTFVDYRSDKELVSKWF